MVFAGVAELDTIGVDELAGGGFGDVTDAGIEAMLASMNPGPALAALLASIDPRQLGDSGRHEMVSSWRRCESWVAAASQAAIVACMDPTDRVVTDRGWLRDEVALSLHLSPGATENRIDVAEALTTILPHTLGALEAGEISYRHAMVITELCGTLDAATAARIETAVLARAADQTPSQFRQAVRRSRLKHAPDLAALDAAAAIRGRQVILYAGEDAMGTVAALLPATDAATVYQAIDTLAHLARDQHRAQTRERSGREMADDTMDDLPGERGIAAWRADVLTDWARSVLADPALPKRHGRPVTINLVIDLATALGLAEHPAELVGYGAIPAAVARELLDDDAVWRNILTDPIDGHLLALGKRHYRARQRKKDHIIARDRTCRFPSCTRAAEHCDIDHAVPYEHGGQTSLENCGCLCRRHHLIKTFGGWQLHSFPDGSCTWTSPCGRTYHIPARRYLETG